MFFKNKKRVNIRNETSNNDSINDVDLNELMKYWFPDGGSISRSALNSATYLACMQIRCNAIAKVPLKLKHQANDNDSAKDAKDHSLYKKLKLRPNPYMSAHDFMWATEFMRLEYGDAFWVKEFVGGKIKNIYLLNSQNVTIYYDNACILGGDNKVFYGYSDSKNGMIYYSVDEIVHFKYFSTDGIKGTPMKKYIADVIDSEKYGRNVIKNKSKDGLQDPIVVEYTGDLNKDKQAKIRKKFSDLGGSSNAGKVIPIPAEFNIKQLETKLVNSQFFELQGLNARQIANAFGVKGFQLNDMEKSTYNNVEQQNKAFYSDTMQNVYTAYEQEIDYKLLFDSERQKGYYTKFNVDVMLRSDIESRYRAYQTGIQTGFLKISEVRKKEDLPYVDGTDVLIIGNGASIPLSDLGKQYANAGGGE